jgi:hypothetical protein
MTDTIDADAVEINKLFRKACDSLGFNPFEAKPAEKAPKKKVSVTHTRHSSGRMSGSRNTDRVCDYREGTNGWLAEQPSSGDVCYYCRERFAPGQIRFRIMNCVPVGWGAALLCMDCFKAETDDSCLGYGATRHTMRCDGCGEQINTIRNPRHRNWYYCSNRCYQRAYRKRRHCRTSVVDWKRENRLPRCQCCRQEFAKRSDALFCSNACRQQMYRKRVAENPHRDRPNWRPGDVD